MADEGVVHQICGEHYIKSAIQGSLKGLRSNADLKNHDLRLALDLNEYFLHLAQTTDEFDEEIRDLSNEELCYALNALGYGKMLPLLNSESLFHISLQHLQLCIEQKLENRALELSETIKDQDVDNLMLAKLLILAYAHDLVKLATTLETKVIARRLQCPQSDIGEECEGEEQKSQFQIMCINKNVPHVLQCILDPRFGNQPTFEEVPQDPRFRNTNVHTIQALQCAHKFGSLEIIAFLLQLGERFNPNQFVDIGLTVFAWVYEFSQLPVWRRILRHPDFDVNGRVFQQCTILGYAARHDADNLVQVIINDPQLDVNALDLEFNIPSFHVAINHNSTKVVTLLAQHVNINYKPLRETRTPFQIARSAKNIAIMSIFLADKRFDASQIEEPIRIDELMCAQDDATVGRLMKSSHVTEELKREFMIRLHFQRIRRDLVMIRIIQ